ncbi:MAG: hypothetical protein ACHQF0_01880 [Chitinophagales bacterium]
MNSTDPLVRSIFQKESLHDCSLEELQTIARQYPYFAPAQFLLTEKLRSTDESLYNQQLEKLSLHFNNPLWLDFLLNGYKTKPIFPIENENSDSPEPAIASEQSREHIEVPDQEAIIKPGSEIAEPIVEEVNEHMIVPPEETNIEEEIQHREVSFGQTIEPATETIKEDINESQNEYLTAAESGVLENKQDVTPGEDVNINTESEISIETKEAINEPHISLSLPTLNREPSETEITFEPYHTVDYFASQGIKFVPEEKPADRFGQQLKSFTEWLKALKRLPQTETIKISDPRLEENVQQLADHSLSEGEVVTETMAEVWLKQGNQEKAIEIYHKLSLLDPPKSAYFASLAERLKNS